MKSLLFIVLLLGLTSSAVVPSKIYVSGTGTSADGTYTYAGDADSRPSYYEESSDHTVYHDASYWIVVGPEYFDEILSSSALPEKTGWTSGTTISYLYEETVIAHRPDLSPEPVELDHELARTNWTGSTAWLTGRMASKTNLTDFSPQRADVSIVSNMCATFDGVGDMITIPASMNYGTDDYYGSAVYKIASNAAGSHELIDGRDANDDGFRILYYSGTLILGHNEYDITIQSTPTNTWVELSWSKVGGTFSASLMNYNTREVIYSATTNVTGGISASSYTTIASGSGSYTGLYYLAVDIARVSLSGVGEFQFSEGSGTNVYDTSGHGNNGTVTVGTGGTTTFWSGRQNVYAANTINGFSFAPAVYKKTMETNFTLSTMSASYEFTTEQAHDGTKSLKVTSDAGTLGWSLGNIHHTAFTATRSGYYKFSGYAKGTAGCQCSFALYNETDSAFVVTRGQYPTTLTGGWDLVGGSVQLVSGKVYRFYYALYDASSVVYFDDVSIIGAVRFPRLTSGTNDVLGLGLTNPSGYVHNNSESLLSIGGTNYSYSNLLTNVLFNTTVDTDGFITEIWK